MKGQAEALQLGARLAEPGYVVQVKITGNQRAANLTSGKPAES